MRRWELVSGTSAKFWEIDQDGPAVTVRFGRLGTAGQTQTKELASTAAAEAHVTKLVTEKEKKGYRPVSSTATAAASAPATPAPSSAATAPAPTPASASTAAATARATAPTPAPAAASTATLSATPDLTAPAADHAASPSTATAPTPAPSSAATVPAPTPTSTSTSTAASSAASSAAATARTTTPTPAPTPASASTAVSPAAATARTTTPTPTPASTTATPSATPGATAPTADHPASPSTATAPPPTKPTSVDENTWSMPKAWLRDALWRRDVEPLPPRFTVSQARAQEFRDWVAANGEEIAEVMAHPMSDQNLVRVLRDQLDGRPTPLGAALLARVAQLHKLSVHWWIAEYGLPFAAAAVVHCCAVVLLGYHNSQTDRSFKARLESAEGRHPDPTDVDGWNLVQIRTALAAADAATYDAAIAELEKVGTTALGQVARAFLVPTRHDWFEEANAHPPRRPGNWMTLGAVSTLEQLARLQSRDLTWSPIALHTALHALGPAIAPFVAEEFDDSRSDADRRRLALKVLAALPTDEAFAILLDRLDTKYVRPVLLSAMAAFPARAARLLAARAATNAEALQLLRAHLMSHPDLEPPTETAALLAEAEARMVPDAPASALPRVLAEAPWSHPRPQPKPLVLKDLPVPDAHISWLPGEREEWLGNGSHRVVELAAWQRAAEEMRAGRHNHHGLFENGPEELARPLLACWVPGDSWGAEDWGRRIAARFELDALPPLLRLAASNPHGCGMILLPYATAEVANLMANWLVRLKTAGAFAAAWLARHGEAAARLLLPAALGAASPQRGYAEFALRHLHLEIGVDVIAVAAAVRPEAGAAVRTLVEVDPLDVLPTKLPEIGDWADTRLLPQVLLADRTAALSAQAATNLLMTAALSKPDAVYAGLPMAVEVCDRESLAEFAWTVFTRWQAEDAPPKDGWALTALGWFGTDETVRRLAPLIRAWPGENAHAKAVTGLDVLAQIGTETALAHLNGIAEKVKFKALKARAQEKVADIAATLGLSRDQLSDRLVPSLGLDDAASLVIDYGSRQFTVGFDEQLKPYVLDPDGKRRKDLPKPGAKDDQEKAPLEHQRFAALKKDVRTVATDQIQRLERAMIAQRTWSAEEFHTVLAAHPLLWHLVRRLVWITDEGLSFRLAEDRTLANAEDDEITLPGDATVRVAHPVDLADTLEAWGEVFADYEILQPFPQLGRPTHSFAAGEPRVPQLHKYLDLPVPVGKILGLTKRGWVRGTPLDAGVEEWITRPLPAGGALVATLDPGIAVGAIDVFPEVKFTSLYFSATGEGHWTAPRDGGPDTFDVDPVTASELLSELESLHH